MVVPAVDPVPSQPIVHQSGTILSACGFTWTFDRLAQIGAFANGDPWAIGPVTIIDISPRPKSIQFPGTSTVFDLNGSELDPDTLEYQGFDEYAGTSDKHSEGHIQYLESKNVGKTIPFAISGTTHGQSLVSTESYPLREGNQAKDRSRIKRAGVLTVFASGTVFQSGLTTPAVGMFRPPYCKAENPVGQGWTFWDQGAQVYHPGYLGWDLSGTIASVDWRSGFTGNTSGQPDIETLADNYRCTRLDHMCYVGDAYNGETPGDAYRIMNDYQCHTDGSDIAIDIGHAAIIYHCSGNGDFGWATNTGRFEDLRRGVIQRAIDMVGIADKMWIDNPVGKRYRTAQPWPAMWGNMNNAGRKFELLFGAYLMGGDILMDHYGTLPMFQEDQQTFTIDQNTVRLGQNYTTGQIGDYEWGVKHGVNHANLDNANWASPDTYNNERANGNASAWWGQTLAARWIGTHLTGYISTPGTTQDIRWGVTATTATGEHPYFGYMSGYRDLAIANTSREHEIALDKWSYNMYWDHYSGDFSLYG